MKRIKVLTYGVLLVIIGIWGICFFANNTYSSDLNEKDEINTILSQLNDPDYRVRDKALWDLLNPRSTKMGEIDSVKEEYRNNERVKSALINLLSWELEQIPVPGEWYGEYTSALWNAVASLNDPRALPYFLNDECIRGGVDAVRYIVAVANPEVVKTLLKRLSKERSFNTIEIEVVIEILGEIVKKKEGYIPTGITREEIKQAIIKTLKESKHPMDKKIENYKYIVEDSAYVRKKAICALGNFEDPGLIPIIRPYLNDPYSEEHHKTELRQEGKKATVVKLGEVTIYPVRDEAQRVLKLLEEKKKEEEARKETENKKK